MTSHTESVDSQPPPPEERKTMIPTVSKPGKQTAPSLALLTLISGLIQSGCTSQPAKAPEAAPVTGAQSQTQSELSRDLAKAIIQGDADTVSALIKKGADVNARIPSIFTRGLPDRQLTPLLIAAIRKDARMTQLLLDAGADPSAEVRAVKAIDVSIFQDDDASAEALATTEKLNRK